MKLGWNELAMDMESWSDGSQSCVWYEKHELQPKENLAHIRGPNVESKHNQDPVVCISNLSSQTKYNRTYLSIDHIIYVILFQNLDGQVSKVHSGPSWARFGRLIFRISWIDLGVSAGYQKMKSKI